MLLRISLVLAILAGIGTIVVTHLKTREHVQGIITVRDENIKGRADEKRRADTAEKTLARTRETLTTTSNALVKTEEELNGTKQELATVRENLKKTTAELVKATEDKKAAQAELAKWEQLGVKPEQVRGIIADVKIKTEAIAALEDEKKILSRRADELQNEVFLLVGKDY